MVSVMKEELAAAGADVNGTLERFMDSESLYERFLKRLPEDSNMGRLREAIEKSEWEAAEQAAHTLKGVTANLGLEPVALIMDQIVKKVRQGETEGYKPILEQGEAKYCRFCDIIAKL